MKKRTVLTVAIALIVLMVLIGLFFKGDLFPPKIDDITSEKGYTITKQEQVEITLSIQTSVFTDAIYTHEGQTFDKNEVIVCQNETTSIYLEKAMLSNESDDQLYFIFNYDYDLPDSGSVLLPYQKTEKGYMNVLDLRSEDIAAGGDIYPESVLLRGQGPSEQFAFYVSADVCRQAEGTMTIEAFCNQLTYRKGR